MILRYFSIFLLLLSLAMPALAQNNPLSVDLYGRLWPKLTYIVQDGDESRTDVTDAISRLGTHAAYQLAHGLTAHAVVEMRINLQTDGDGRQAGEYFLSENLGYIALAHPQLGQLALGTQWNPYYTAVATPADVYYHAASPFGYDTEGPFREEKLLRYTVEHHGLSIDAAVQFKGQGQGNGDYDKLYGGLSYVLGPFRIGLGYLSDETGETRTDHAGISARLALANGLAVAFAWQHVFPEAPHAPDRSTLDAAAVYTIEPHGLTLIAGVFAYDDGTAEGLEDGSHLGHNLTVVKRLGGRVDVFAEWLHRNYEQPHDDNQDEVSLGVRVDFNASLI